MQMAVNFYKLFLEKAKELEDKTAIRAGNNKATYKQLLGLTDVYAEKLREKGITQNHIVILFMGSSIEMVAFMLAVLKLGAIVLPIDETTPIARVELISRASGASCIVGNKAYLNEMEGLNISVLPVEDYEDIAVNIGDGLSHEYVYNETAFCLFTSGSTGVPKGVLLTNEGILNHIQAKRDIVNLDEDSVLCLSFSISFVASIWQIISPLICGASLILYSRQILTSPELFFESIDRDKVSIVSVIPGFLQLYNEIAGHKARKADLSNLRFIFLTGEKVDIKVVKRFYELYNIQLINAYGQSECSDDTFHYVIPYDIESADVPIGKPVANIKPYILDGSLKELGNHLAGELCIAGICLAIGYLNNPELTKDKFIYDEAIGEFIFKTGDLVKRLDDGNFVYIGRSDNQIKIRGFRIEPEEIEKTILAIEAISQAVVVSVNQNGTEHLVCFYRGDPSLDERGIREWIAKKLPEYMVPSEFLETDIFPLSINGKIDRRMLSASYWDNQNSMMDTIPQDASLEKDEILNERNLINIVKKNMNRRHSNNINMATNFDELAVDSLTFVKIVVDIEDYYDIEFDYDMLAGKSFETLQDMADYVSECVHAE